MKVSMNGEKWFISSLQKCGDMVISTGIKCEDARILVVHGENRTVKLYRALIEAVNLFNMQGNHLKLYLDIPYLVRDELKRWLNRSGLTESVAFSGTKQIGKKELEEGIFVENMITNSSFQDCFVISSRSEIIPGNITELLNYLKENFGE